MMKKLWELEKNRESFTNGNHECVVKRNSMGVLCGYVNVGKEHPLFGLEYGDYVKVSPEIIATKRIDMSKIDIISLICHDKDRIKNNELPISLLLSVHGGITWASDNVPNEDSDGNWWFGFDCGHAGDLIPSFADMHILDDLFGESVYRDMEYVKNECIQLCNQLDACEVILIHDH